MQGGRKVMGDIQNIQKVRQPWKLRSYFRLEKGTLLIVTVSGILYNIGMTAGPYFEGKLVQRLIAVLGGEKTWSDMLALSLVYLAVIFAVQALRCVKRFYVRRFANNTGRNMRHMLYNSLVHKGKEELDRESVGAVMTKAVADVDACVEGMRKFTTEIFDTGVVLAAYLAMLFYYDWRLTLLSCVFTPIAYLTANRLKTVVTRCNAAYKQSAGKLNDATLDRVSNAVTYRVYARESDRDAAYDEKLADYEKRAVAANVWETSMKPVYHIISMCGVIPLLSFGAANVRGTGWAAWDIAAFTTFLSCFAKMANKSSSAAKLFNAVQKAKVSWKRIRPLMKDYIEWKEEAEEELTKPQPLDVRDLSFAYPGGAEIFGGITFHAEPGEIIGVTGAVASGKSTFGRAFLCEQPYGGSIRFGERELSGCSHYERSRIISYMGHDAELLSDTVEENVRLGKTGDAGRFLAYAQLEREVDEMPDGAQTSVGDGGVRLSGGQRARVALARTLFHGQSILILDDPFSAVDGNTEREIMKELRSFAKDKIVILISHRLTLFPEFDRIIWMEDGRGTVGTHAGFMETNRVYAKLYRTQISGGGEHEA